MCREDRDFLLGAVMAVIFIIVILCWKPIPKAVNCGPVQHVNPYEEYIEAYSCD